MIASSLLIHFARLGLESKPKVFFIQGMTDSVQRAIFPSKQRESYRKASMT
jgi:hypothetical protein